MAMIDVDGHKYEVSETLGTQQCGMLAKALKTKDGERIAVRCGGRWKWWTALDRLQPRGRFIGMLNCLI